MRHLVRRSAAGSDGWMIGLLSTHTIFVPAIPSLAVKGVRLEKLNFYAVFSTIQA
jgi:hypothetical protein